MAIMMFYLGFYVRFSPPKDGAAIGGAGYVALVAVYLFAAAFQFGWGPVCWIYVSEIPTSRLRGLNVSLAAATQWYVLHCPSRLALVADLIQALQLRRRSRRPSHAQDRRLPRLRYLFHLRLLLRLYGGHCVVLRA